MCKPQLPLTGACLCGSVQIRVTAQPLLTLACHCKDCQRLCASAYSLTAMIPASGFSSTGELTVGGRHSEQRQHFYCANCLNFVFSRLKGAPGRVNLRATVLEDLSWFAPFAEVMTRDKLPWAHVPAAHSYESFPQSAEEIEALMAEYSGQPQPGAEP